MSDFPVQLSFVNYQWDLRIKECPCDVHFIDWLDENSIKDASIFHFGTGGHHHVGIECAKPERRNSVLGITAAPQEIESFIAFVVDRPGLARYYTAVFGDIYLINSKLLPCFDVVTLFHLCEFRNWAHDLYGGMTDLEVTQVLTDKTRSGGYILFYPGSLGFNLAGNAAADVIAQWAEESPVERVGEFKTLLVYRKRG